MHFHILQHVPFENEGYIADYAKSNKIVLSKTRLYSQSEELPNHHDYDLLIILGGPMNIYEEQNHPWLRSEKKFIQDSIRFGKYSLGICLGAQLLAEALDASIVKNADREIGWFNVDQINSGETICFRNFPNDFMAMHWHGDTFDIPQNARHTAKSKACANQSFEFDNRVFAVQFHLESSLQGIQSLVKQCGEDLDGSTFVQDEKDILQLTHINESNRLMSQLLKNICGEIDCKKTKFGIKQDC